MGWKSVPSLPLMALQSSEGIREESSFLIDFDDRPINAMYGKTDRSIPREKSDDGQNVTRSALLSDTAAIILNQTTLAWVA